MSVLKILLLEDNQGDARLIEFILSAYSDPVYQITHFERLREAAAALAQRTFDVALVDLTVPDSSGLATVTAITAISPQMPLIVLTGLSDEKLGQEAVQLGAQDFLTKGDYDDQLLARTISYAISRQKMTNALQASEDRIRTIIESNADGIVVVDEAKTICFVNPAAQNLFGESQEKLIGSTFPYSYRPGEVFQIMPSEKDMRFERWSCIVSISTGREAQQSCSHCGISRHASTLKNNCAIWPPMIR